MLSLAELRRAVRLVDAERVGARVEGAWQIDAQRVVLALRRPGQPAAALLLCADPRTARLGTLARRPEAPPSPGPFARLLRKRLGGGRLVAAEIWDDDRQAALRVETPDGACTLLLAFLGPRTNLYLLDAMQRVVAALRPLAETRSELAPGAVWQAPGGRPPPEGADRFVDVPDAGFFVALEHRYAAQEAEGEREALHRRLERALRRADEGMARKTSALERDAGDAALAERARRHGELLKGALDRVAAGATELRTRDWETGEEVTIPLDPSRSPAANLEGLFRRARKAERRARRAAAELGVLAERRRELAALRQDLEARASESEASLEELAQRPELQRLLARHAPQARPAARARSGPVRLAGRDVPRRLLPRRYRSTDGLEIWVGRSDEGNDLLTTRLARGNDLFFHLDASPGSHVVLRTEGRSDPPPESMLEACELAVHFSRQREAGRIDVLVVPIKQVRKPRGARPGLVFVSGGRSVRLRRDSRRLERVLAARLDEADGA